MAVSHSASLIAIGNGGTDSSVKSQGIMESIIAAVAAIDPKYYDTDGHSFHGSAQDFDNFFNPKICSFEQLFNNAKPTMLATNSGHGDEHQCVGMVGRLFSPCDPCCVLMLLIDLGRRH